MNYTCLKIDFILKKSENQTISHYWKEKATKNKTLEDLAKVLLQWFQQV